MVVVKKSIIQQILNTKYYIANKEFLKENAEDKYKKVRIIKESKK